MPRGVRTNLHLANKLLLAVCVHVLAQASSVNKGLAAVVEGADVLQAYERKPIETHTAGHKHAWAALKCLRWLYYRLCI